MFVFYRKADFTDWIAFGGPALKSDDPVAEGHPVTPEMVSRRSPYLTGHIRRFGQYVLERDHKPEPLRPAKVKLPTLPTALDRISELERRPDTLERRLRS